MFHVKQKKALLINPYIYDFSAYSFWSAPLGLLYIGSILRENGFEVHLVDCLEVNESKRKSDGRGPFIKEKVEPPPHLKMLKKRLKRYGISEDILLKRLENVPYPDIVLITSIMTYWYMGALEVVECVKKIFPGAKIVLGGLYPTLCYEHAVSTFKSVDLIVRHNEIDLFYDFIEDALSVRLSFKYQPHQIDALPYPCFDLYEKIHFVPLITSFGCMYNCAYCATPYMYPKIIRKKPPHVMDEVIFWLKKGVKRFVLYDDNFLYKREEFAKPLLNMLGKLNEDIEIYNPNALNAALIDDELAGLLKYAGFKEVRLGLESIDPLFHNSVDNKVNKKSFEDAVRSLKKAGFSGHTIGVYILSGLPFQKWTEVKDAIDYLIDLGVRPHIAEFTPIPHTPLFESYSNHARYPVKEDPIFQNNALFPFSWEGFTEEDLLYLKHYLKEKLKNILP